MNRALVIFLFIMFCACDRIKSNDAVIGDSVLRIDLLLEPEPPIKKLSEIAENVEYIPLQTTKNSLIYNFILKVVTTDNRIYILNGGLKGEIMCFDMNGRFLYKLQNSGRGPEEYTSITDFDVSSDNKFLLILSSTNHKLLTYKISENGLTFEKSISLKDPFPYRINLIPETDKVFLAIPPWRGTETTLSILINIAGDTIHFKPNCYKYTVKKGSYQSSLDEMLVYSIGNTVCFKEEFSDTVFYVDAKDNSFKPLMILDSHGTLISPEIRSDLELFSENTIFIANIFESSRYVIYRSQSKNFLFDKKTKRKYELNIETISQIIADRNIDIPKNILKDDLSGGPNFQMDLNGWDRLGHNGKMFSIVDAITFKRYFSSENFKKAKVSDSKKADIKKIADSLTETDNPILVIVTPKEYN